MTMMMRRNGLQELVMLHETMDQLLDGSLTRAGARGITACDARETRST